MALVRLLTTLAWGAVFFVLLIFAIKNTETVTLRFALDQAWHAPLVFVVLASFASGAVFGVLACLPVLVRQRRTISGLQKELRLRGAAPEEPHPPAPPMVPDVPSAP